MSSASLGKPLTESHLKRYQYTVGQYYSPDGKVIGRWHGQLCELLGVKAGAAVEEDALLMLGHGARYTDGAQLIEHRKVKPVYPEWAINDRKWQDFVNSLYEEAYAKGIYPFEPDLADVFKQCSRSIAKATGQDPGELEAEIRCNYRYAVEARDPLRSDKEIAEVRYMCNVLHKVPNPAYRVEVGLGMAKFLHLPAPELPEQRKQREHRACFGLVLSPPKSVSITALVGKDERVREAHGKAVLRTLDYIEQYTQGRIGGNHPPDTTGKWVAAVFEHDTSRPANGYPAPQLHTHVLVMNMTLCSDAKFRALQPRELYRIQRMISEVYRAELMRELRAIGHELERTEKAFEIAGYSPEYLAAESPRRHAIVQEMEDRGVSGPASAEIVAKQNREAKLDLTPEELWEMHRAHAAAYGMEPDRVVAESYSKLRTCEISQEQDAAAAVAFAMQHVAERPAVFDHHELVKHALRYGFGSYQVEDVEREIARRLERGEIQKVEHVRPHAPMARYATQKQLEAERTIIQRAVAGQGTVTPIVEQADLSRYAILAGDENRQAVIRAILATRDQTVILQGSAGVGKTTALGIVAEIARERGLRVVGLAPTGKAASALREAGIEADTVAKYVRSYVPKNKPSFYLLDEASLVSAKSMLEFVRLMRPEDRVLLIGDDSPKKAVGQHTSIEAGRMFHQLQQAGVKTAYLNRIVRQQEPWLLETVKHLRAGRTAEAVDILTDQERIEEYGDRKERFRMMALSYAVDPTGTLIVSPDNASRQEINSVVRDVMQRVGMIRDEHQTRILVGRDLTRADRTLATSYRPQEYVRYLTGSKALGIKGGEYGQVLDVDRGHNLLTVQFAGGRTVQYDPRKALGNCAVYESREIGIGIGDRVQFTAPCREKAVRTRETGTVTEFDGREMVIALDGGKTVRISTSKFRHFDHAYAMTSQAAQSMTVDRVLVHVDTSDKRLWALHNAVFGYVAGSRSRTDLVLYTDCRERLVKELSRQVEKYTALSVEQIQQVAMEVA